MYKIKVGGKEERERLWGLTIRLEKLEFNSLGNGEVISVSSEKNHVTKRTVAQTDTVAHTYRMDLEVDTTRAGETGPGATDQ